VKIIVIVAIRSKTVEEASCSCAGLVVSGHGSLGGAGETALL
jgi:hypothetical protein